MSDPGAERLPTKANGSHYSSASSSQFFVTQNSRHDMHFSTICATRLLHGSLCTDVPRSFHAWCTVFKKILRSFKKNPSGSFMCTYFHLTAQCSLFISIHNLSSGMMHWSPINLQHHGHHIWDAFASVNSWRHSVHSKRIFLPWSAQRFYLKVGWIKEISHPQHRGRFTFSPNGCRLFLFAFSVINTHFGTGVTQSQSPQCRLMSKSALFPRRPPTS